MPSKERGKNVKAEASDYLKMVIAKFEGRCNGNIVYGDRSIYLTAALFVHYHLNVSVMMVGFETRINCEVFYEFERYGPHTLPHTHTHPHTLTHYCTDPGRLAYMPLQLVEVDPTDTVKS